MIYWLKIFFREVAILWTKQFEEINGLLNNEIIQVVPDELRDKILDNMCYLTARAKKDKLFASIIIKYYQKFGEEGLINYKNSLLYDFTLKRAEIIECCHNLEAYNKDNSINILGFSLSLPESLS